MIAFYAFLQRTKTLMSLAAAAATAACFFAAAATEWSGAALTLITAFLRPRE